MKDLAPEEMPALLERVKELEAEVTALRASSEALRASRDNLEALIENTDDFILFSDAKAQPVVFNSAYARVMKEMLGLEMRPGLQPHSALTDPQARVWWDGQHARVLAGEKFRVEFPFESESNGTRYFEVLFNPIIREGCVVGFSEFTREITGRRRAEDEKVELQRQLLESQKMEALGRLAGGMAHEFNNVLAVLLGSAQLLEKQIPAGEPARVQVDRMVRVSSRARDLTSKLLALARREQLSRAPVALATIVAELLEILAGSVAKEIRVTTELGVANATVDADQGQLLLALLNLCINAADSMPSGGALHISTEIAPDGSTLPSAPGGANGAYVAIHLRDSGAGMSPEVLAHVFEPFFTSKERGAGTGLGLPVSRGIVEGHGGWIELQSSQGGGTEARVYLPIAAQPEAVSEPQAPTTSAPSGAGTLLLVDDEDDLLDVLRLHLEEEGHRVLTAPSGEQAIAVFRDHHRSIDAVLLDVVMPGLDGAQTLERLRSIDPECKVILCSGYRDRKRSDELKALGANWSLPKPFTVQELDQMLDRVLGKAG